MPANAGDVNNIYFFTVRLFHWLSNRRNTKFLRQIFLAYRFPKLIYVIYLNGQHEVFGKRLIVVLL